MSLLFYGKDDMNCTNAVFTKVNHYIDLINEGKYASILISTNSNI